MTRPAPRPTARPQSRDSRTQRRIISRISVLKNRVQQARLRLDATIRVLKSAHHNTFPSALLYAKLDGLHSALETILHELNAQPWSAIRQRDLHRHFSLATINHDRTNDVLNEIAATEHGPQRALLALRGVRHDGELEAYEIISDVLIGSEERLIKAQRRLYDILASLNHH